MFFVPTSVYMNTAPFFVFLRGWGKEDFSSSAPYQMSAWVLIDLKVRYPHKL